MLVCLRWSARRRINLLDMKINEDVCVLVLPMSFGGQVRELNLTLILDPSGATLVDTGLPGQEEEILKQVAEAGVPSDGLKRILITHHDIDHVGSLHALKEKTGATVLVPAEEVPYVDGRKQPQKMPPPERLAQMPEFKAILDQKQPTPVDEPLADGQRLDFAGGVRVIGTPGHTIGHASLYLERTKTLITGDALTAENGQLSGPSGPMTPDMEEAMKSVKKLAELDVETIVCYHGGVIKENANEQLQRVAGTG